MQIVKNEELSESRIKLTVEVTPEDVRAQREEAYDQLGNEVALPGFRKGHVPRRFLEYRFDKELIEQAFTDAVVKGLTDLIKEQDLEVLGMPTYEDKEWSKKGPEALESPVQLVMTLDIVPKFELQEYTGKELEIEDFVVTEEQIDETLEGMRERFAKYEAVTDRPVAEGDVAVVDLSVTRGEEVITELTRDRYFIDLTNPDDIDEIDKSVIGKSLEETYSFTFELDASYDSYEQDGENSVEAEATVVEIHSRTLPEIDDELAKSVGLENLEAWREGIRGRFNEQREEILNQRRLNAVEDMLLEQHPFEVPANLVEYTYTSLLRDKRIESLRRQEPDPLSLPEEERSKLEATTREEAESSSRLRLILEKIAKQEDLKVEEDDYYEEMITRAVQQGYKNPDRFLAEVDKRGLEDSYKERMLFTKVEQMLVDKNTFNLKPASESTGSAPADDTSTDADA